MTVSVAADAQGQVVLASFDDVHAALRNRDLARVGPADQPMLVGNILESSLVVLHAEAHHRRRSAESVLFTRKVRSRYEQEDFPDVLTRLLAARPDPRRLELVEYARRAAIIISARTVGLELDETSAEQCDRLGHFARTFAEGAAIEDSLQPDQVLTDVAEGLAAFDREFFEPALQRRMKAKGHEATGDDDLLSILLGQREKLELDRARTLRETGFFLAASADTSTHGITNLMDNIFTWCGEHPEAWDQLDSNRAVLQQFLHESLRMRPIVPYVRRRALRDTRINDREVATDTKVLVDLYAASCDESVYGADAPRFNPWRQVAARAPRYGMAFGGGTHVCLGNALAAGSPGGRDAQTEGSSSSALFGLITIQAQLLLANGARPDPDAEATLDPTSRRWTRFVRYPLVLTSATDEYPARLVP